MKKSADKNTFEKISHVILFLVSLTSLLPFVLLLMASLTDENVLLSKGYSFFPAKLSLSAYTYLLDQSSVIVHGYLITIFVTVVGTVVSLVITSLFAYTLSRKDFPFSRGLTLIVYITMLFNGGLVPTYFLYSSTLGLKNTIWALLIPGLLMNGFNVMIMKTFFKNNVPEAVIESATVDGAGKFKTFYLIVLPLSLPIMATIGLFVAIAYWNDWYNGLIYLTDSSLFSIQNILNRIMTDAQFLTNSNLGTNAGSIDTIPTTAVRMAIAVVGLLPILVAYPFFQKYFVKGITLGAVKG